MRIRTRSLIEIAKNAGVELSEDRAVQLIEGSWTEHVDAWRRGLIYGSSKAANLISESLEFKEGLAEMLAVALEDASTEVGTRPVPGAADALALLKRHAIPSALICDTGFTPSRHVRRFLEEHGLAVDHYFFSDIVGRPKPHRAMFDAALDAIGIKAPSAVHIGDLRRTDIAGARSVGMGTVRFAGVHDDGLAPDGTSYGIWTESAESEGEDADAVIYGWDELASVLAL